MLSDPLLVVQKAVMCFDFLDIKYLIGGSLASSLYGIPRATQDVDIVAEAGLIKKYGSGIKRICDEFSRSVKKP